MTANSHLPFDHHLLDLGDGLGRIETLRAGIRTIHDRMAAIKPERIFEIIKTIAGRFIAAIDQPTIGLQENRRT